MVIIERSIKLAKDRAMVRMKQHFINIDGKELHVRVWNEQADQTVFCSHGFTSTSADFLVLGELLAQEGYRVIAPDTLGRGLSQWSRLPDKEYNLPYYAKMAALLMQHFECGRCHWIGSDMGALIGILLASNDKYRHLFASLSLNDTGPEISRTVVKQMVTWAKEKRCFPEFKDAEQFLSKGYFPACQNDAVWQTVCESSIRRLAVGGFTLHYDHNIFLYSQTSTIKLWNRFETLLLPMMVMYGVNSQVLSKATLTKMRRYHPELMVNYYLGCQHTPSLLSPFYCQDVLSFLQQQSHSSSAPIQQAQSAP